MATKTLHQHDLEKYVWAAIDTYCSGDALLHPTKIREILQKNDEVSATDKEIVEIFFRLRKDGRLDLQVKPDGSIRFHLKN